MGGLSNKNFGWTQGIKGEKLDTLFAEKAADAEAEIADIVAKTVQSNKSFDLNIPVITDEAILPVPIKPSLIFNKTKLYYF